MELRAVKDSLPDDGEIGLEFGCVKAGLEETLATVDESVMPAWKLALARNLAEELDRNFDAGPQRRSDHPIYRTRRIAVRCSGG